MYVCVCVCVCVYIGLQDDDVCKQLCMYVCVYVCVCIGLQNDVAAGFSTVAGPAWPAGGELLLLQAHLLKSPLFASWALWVLCTVLLFVLNFSWYRTCC
jgi:hypothetical protein